MTVAVAVDGRSGDAGFGVEGGGLAGSSANAKRTDKTQIAAKDAGRLTLMLTPNLPRLCFLET